MHPGWKCLSMNMNSSCSVSWTPRIVVDLAVSIRKFGSMETKNIFSTT